MFNSSGSAASPSFSSDSHQTLDLRKRFFDHRPDRRHDAGHGDLSISQAVYAVDSVYSILVFMTVLETQLVVYIPDDKQTRGQPDGQPRNVYGRIEFLPDQASYGRLDVIAEHLSPPTGWYLLLSAVLRKHLQTKEVP
jgi:hypothetical protein